MIGGMNFRVTNLDELRKKILQLYASITPNQRMYTILSLYYRFGYCLAEQGEPSLHRVCIRFTFFSYILLYFWF